MSMKWWDWFGLLGFGLLVLGIIGKFASHQ